MGSRFFFNFARYSNLIALKLGIVNLAQINEFIYLSDNCVSVMCNLLNDFLFSSVSLLHVLPHFKGVTVI